MAASITACCNAVVFLYQRSHGSCIRYSQFVRCYARGIIRKPVAVRTAEEELVKLKAKGIAPKDPRLNPWIPYVPGDPTQVHSEQSKEQPNFPSSKGLKTSKERKVANKAARGVTKELTKLGLTYEKLEDGDKRFGRVLISAKSRKEREKKGIILLEGRRLILDALKAGAQLKYLYFTDVESVSGLPKIFLEDVELYKVQYRHLKLFAETHTPSGLLGVFSKPAEGEVLNPQPDALPLTLICDKVSDPGNLGTIIRTAAAAGCQKIITTKGCVDPWDPKVLRGAMGGHFYTCILSSLPWEQITSHVSQESFLCIADSRKAHAVERSFDMSNSKVLDLVEGENGSDSESGTDSEGSSETESDGSSDESGGEESGDEKKTWKRKRRDEKKEKPEKESVDNSGLWSQRKSKPYKRVPMSVVQYHDLDCGGYKDVTVIVGGEAEGISAQAQKFAFQRFGQYVTIPMLEGINSLNAGAAAAIVLYEVRRLMVEQLDLKKRARNKGSSASVQN